MTHTIARLCTLTTLTAALLSASCGDPGDPMSAYVTIDGARTIRGTFAVHAVTWG